MPEWKCVEDGRKGEALSRSVSVCLNVCICIRLRLRVRLYVCTLLLLAFIAHYFHAVVAQKSYNPAVQRRVTTVL